MLSSMLVVLLAVISCSSSVDQQWCYCRPMPLETDLSKPQVSSQEREIQIIWDTSRSMVPYYRHADRRASALFALWADLERLWLRDISHVNNYKHQGIGNVIVNLLQPMDSNGRILPLAMNDDFSNLAMSAQIMGERFTTDGNITGVLLISDLILETPSREFLRRHHLDQHEMICDDVKTPIHSLTPSLFGRCLAAPFARQRFPDVSAGVIMLRKPVLQNNAPANASPLFIFWMFRGGELGTKVASSLTRNLQRFDPVPIYFFEAQNSHPEQFSKIRHCRYNQSTTDVFALTSAPLMSPKELPRELSPDSICEFYFVNQQASHSITCTLSTDPDARAKFDRVSQSCEVEGSVSPDLSGEPQFICLFPHLSSVIDERGEKKIPHFTTEEGEAIEVTTTCQASQEASGVNYPRLRLEHEWYEKHCADLFEHLVPDYAPKKNEIVSLLNGLRYFFHKNIMLEDPKYTVKYKDTATLTK